MNKLFIRVLCRMAFRFLVGIAMACFLFDVTKTLEVTPIATVIVGLSLGWRLAK